MRSFIDQPKVTELHHFSLNWKIQSRFQEADQHISEIVMAMAIIFLEPLSYHLNSSINWGGLK
ncbi:hypothetical protein AEM38_05195 [Hyphomonadaceae bacterium UKL13-1]|nr:hypothetical protein AEM38_05195 [Hyphomonadaceae bacterium UKL13-1]